MGWEQAERSVPSGIAGPGVAGGPRRATDGRCRGCRGGLLAGGAFKSPQPLRWGSRSGPSSSVSPLRAQGALRLGGLQEGLALLRLKPLEPKWGHPLRGHGDVGGHPPETPVPNAPLPQASRDRDGSPGSALARRGFGFDALNCAVGVEKAPHSL